MKLNSLELLKKVALIKKLSGKEKLEKVISLKFNEGCKWNLKYRIKEKYQKKMTTNKFKLIYIIRVNY